MAKIDKTKFRTGNALGGLEIAVGLDGHSYIDYDRKPLRRMLNKGAAVVRKEARRIVSRRAISRAGEIPGMQTGTMRKAIGTVSRGSKGGWVKVGVRTIPDSAFYPAFLFYGSPKTGLQKRKNFMENALTTKREEVRGMIRAALKDALVPR